MRLPLPAGLERGRQLEVVVDGLPTVAYEDETVAAVLLADGDIATRTTVNGARRGVFCGMGVCFDCLVVVDDVPNTRACWNPIARSGRSRERVNPVTMGS